MINNHISQSQEVVTVTKSQLFQIFSDWEDERRCGKCETTTEIDKQTIEEVAENTTDSFCERVKLLQFREG